MAGRVAETETGLGYSCPRKCRGEEEGKNGMRKKNRKRK